MNYRRRKSLLAFSVFAFACIGFSFAFQKNTHQIWGQRLVDSLSETQKREAQHALKGLVVHPELELKVFATEPMLQNPTNIDVDAKGRVWVPIITDRALTETQQMRKATKSSFWKTATETAWPTNEVYFTNPKTSMLPWESPY